MRKTRIGAFVASTAFASATILGGAGVASAGSLDLGSLDLGSLGSAGEVAEPALALTIEEAGVEGVNGELFNLTENEATNCVVAVSTADVAAKYEAFYAANEEFPAEGSAEDDALQAANEKSQNWLAFPGTVVANDDVSWEGTQGPNPAEDDYRAGAWVQCDIDGEPQVAFAYEPAEPVGSVEGFIGSIDFGGSLGSLSGS